jgi:membrane-bound ClpP family serine protease
MTGKQKTSLEKPTKRQSFASNVQLILILLLTGCFILITQRYEKDVYGYGVIALIILTLLQIAFGNIPPGSNWKVSLLGVVIAAGIIGTIVAISIWIAPFLLQLGR